MKIHHIGLAVEQIETITEYLYTIADVETVSDIIYDKEQNAHLRMVVSSPKPAVLFDHRRVAFVMTKLGLLELVEE